MPANVDVRTGVGAKLLSKWVLAGTLAVGEAVLAFVYRFCV